MNGLCLCAGLDRMTNTATRVDKEWTLVSFHDTKEHLKLHKNEITQRIATTSARIKKMRGRRRHKDEEDTRMKKTQG